MDPSNDVQAHGKNDEPATKKPKTTAENSLQNIEILTLQFENNQLKKYIAEMKSGHEGTEAELLEANSKIKIHEENIQALEEKIKKLENENSKLKAENMHLKKNSNKCPSDSSPADNGIVGEVEQSSQLPKLSPEQQAAADRETNELPRGARVFVAYGKVYYSAVVDSFDNKYGRYKVIFVEGQSSLCVQRKNIIPLGMLQIGNAVSVLAEIDEDGERVSYDGTILSIPDISNDQQWHRGLYSIEVWNDFVSEARKIEWCNICFSEKQYKEINKNASAIRNRLRPRPSTAAAAGTSATPLPPSSRSKPEQKPSSSMTIA